MFPADAFNVLFTSDAFGVIVDDDVIVVVIMCNAGVVVMGSGGEGVVVIMPRNILDVVWFVMLPLFGGNDVSAIPKSSSKNITNNSNKFIKMIDTNNATMHNNKPLK